MERGLLFPKGAQGVRPAGAAGVSETRSLGHHSGAPSLAPGRRLETKSSPNYNWQEAQEEKNKGLWVLLTGH